MPESYYVDIGQVSFRVYCSYHRLAVRTAGLLVAKSAEMTCTIVSHLKWMILNIHSAALCSEQPVVQKLL